MYNRAINNINFNTKKFRILSLCFALCFLTKLKIHIKYVKFLNISKVIKKEKASSFNIA